MHFKLVIRIHLSNRCIFCAYSTPTWFWATIYFHLKTVCSIWLDTFCSVGIHIPCCFLASTSLYLNYIIMPGWRILQDLDEVADGWIFQTAEVIWLEYFTHKPVLCKEALHLLQCSLLLHNDNCSLLFLRFIPCIVHVHNIYYRHTCK